MFALALGAIVAISTLFFLSTIFIVNKSTQETQLAASKQAIPGVKLFDTQEKSLSHKAHSLPSTSPALTLTPTHIDPASGLGDFMSSSVLLSIIRICTIGFVFVSVAIFSNHFPKKLTRILVKNVLVEYVRNGVSDFVNWFWCIPPQPASPLTRAKDRLLSVSTTILTTIFGKDSYILNGIYTILNDVILDGMLIPMFNATIIYPCTNPLSVFIPVFDLLMYIPRISLNVFCSLVFEPANNPPNPGTDPYYPIPLNRLAFGRLGFLRSIGVIFMFGGILYAYLCLIFALWSLNETIICSIGMFLSQLFFEILTILWKLMVDVFLMFLNFLWVKLFTMRIGKNIWSYFGFGEKKN